MRVGSSTDVFLHTEGLSQTTAARDVVPPGGRATPAVRQIDRLRGGDVTSRHFPPWDRRPLHAATRALALTAGAPIPSAMPPPGGDASSGARDRLPIRLQAH